MADIQTARRLIREYRVVLLSRREKSHVKQTLNRQRQQIIKDYKQN